VERGLPVIKNQHQYRVTGAQLKRLEEALERTGAAKASLEPALHEAAIAASCRFARPTNHCRSGGSQTCPYMRASVRRGRCRKWILQSAVSVFLTSVHIV
jgi:hypothetical protein